MTPLLQTLFYQVPTLTIDNTVVYKHHSPGDSCLTYICQVDTNTCKQAEALGQTPNVIPNVKYKLKLSLSMSRFRLLFWRLRSSASAMFRCCLATMNALMVSAASLCWLAGVGVQHSVGGTLYDGWWRFGRVAGWSREKVLSQRFNRVLSGSHQLKCGWKRRERQRRTEKARVNKANLASTCQV